MLRWEMVSKMIMPIHEELRFLGSNFNDEDEGGTDEYMVEDSIELQNKAFRFMTSFGI